jgi:hypothetical protein
MIKALQLVENDFITGENSFNKQRENERPVPQFCALPLINFHDVCF